MEEVSGVAADVLVAVERVVLEPMQTVGTGYGEMLNGSGKVEFVGDHRMMADIAKAVYLANGEVLDLPVAVVAPWQIRQVIGIDESFDGL